MGKPSLSAEVFLAALMVAGCSKAVDRASPAPEAVPRNEPPAATTPVVVSATPLSPPGAPIAVDEKASVGHAAKPLKAAASSSAQASCGQGSCSQDMKQK